MEEGCDTAYTDNQYNSDLFFCNMQRILLFSVVNLSKYESYVLPHTSNPI